MRKLYDVGINDVDYNISSYVETVNGKQIYVTTCPFYRVWQDMLRRCYDKKRLEKHPTYIGTSVVEEWFYLSNFKAWMEQQDYVGKQLDKDLLVRGNKQYGPETCVFINGRINTFILENSSRRGEYPIGVTYDKRVKKFTATCKQADSRKKNLGHFTDPQEAHEVWLAFKLEQARILASEQTDERVAKALIDRYENYNS